MEFNRKDFAVFNWKHALTYANANAVDNGLKRKFVCCLYPWTFPQKGIMACMENKMNSLVCVAERFDSLVNFPIQALMKLCSKNSHFVALSRRLTHMPRACNMIVGKKEIVSTVQRQI